MKRLVLDKLKAWKNKSNKKPLILYGARQVGKTWLMMEFGKTYYKNTIYISFDNNPIVKSIFEKDFDINRILISLENQYNTKIDNDTLLIFDEIQEVPLALTSLKYFYENRPDVNIVCAGSMLGIALHPNTNFPVGKVEYLNIYPMTFKEFLIAMDKENLFNLLCEKNWNVINGIKSLYIDLLREYYVVGGMPECVQAFVNNNNFSEVREIQNRILRDYDNDFSKHAPNEIIMKIKQVWHSIPVQLAKENKKFVYSELKKGAGANVYDHPIKWLVDCGLIYQIPRLTTPKIPFSAYDSKAFKLYMLDTGLLGALSLLDPNDLLFGNKAFMENKGALTEQYVCQELKALDNLNFAYYSNEKNTCEVDFIAKIGNIVPIEVKAELNTKAKSLKSYMDKYKPDFAIRTSMSEYKENNNLYDIPLYGISEITSIKN